MSSYESFPSTESERDVALEVCIVPAGLRFTVHGSSVVSSWVDPKYAPAIALSVLKAAGQESVIVPKPTVPVEAYPGGDLRCGMTDAAKNATAGWARSRASELLAIAEYIESAAAREAAEKAEAEAAEKKLSARRDAIAQELSESCYDDFDPTSPFIHAIDRIIELEDGTSRD